MRLQTTTGFSAAIEAHRVAYAAWNKVQDDPDIADFSPEDVAASEVESTTLDDLLGYPATTPAEIAAKLAFMREREASNWTGYPAWIEQIERELVELQRPCVSPAMHVAFADWRAAHALYNAHFGEVTAQADEKAALQAYSAAFLAMMALPCITPGDFVVKVWANQLGEHGPTVQEPGGSLFELDDSDLTCALGSHDGAAEEAFARDIRECDLGRCLLMLGRVDFDAEAWFDAARRVGMFAHVIVQQDGSSVLWTGQPEGEITDRDARRFDMCQALLGAGMGIVGADRRHTVRSYIADSQPSFVMDCRKIVGEAA